MRAYARPMLVTDLGGAWEGCSALEPMPLSGKASDGLYSEAWLQGLIQRHPTLLPVDEIEPGLVPLVPVCIELPIASGFADNLMMTPNGEIVLVETKLWRNPEARRAVVGQVLEYAKDLSRWDYASLEAAVRTARKAPTLDLFRTVCGGDTVPEAEGRFVDAVSRNLRLGRFFLIIAGDGIQENVEQLADFLTRYLGLHFTLALIEISLWRAPGTGQVFVQPKVLARTKEIVRAVVRLEPGVALDTLQIAPASPAARPTSLTAEAYYEALAAADPQLPDRLKAFLVEAEPLGVYPQIIKNLSLKWADPGGREFQLGVVDLKGRISTDYAHFSAQQIGRVDLSHAYEAELAAAVPGASVRQTPTAIGWRIVKDGETLPVAALLDHKAAWLAAIETYTDALRRAAAPTSDA